MQKTPTRRQFLKKSVGASTASWIGANTLLATSPSSRQSSESIHVGLIGCGGRGNHLLRHVVDAPNARAVAVCDVHADRLARARMRAGGSNVAAYRDYRQLLADKNVDVVIVATTGHWHALCTIHACQAEKDVYVEKPLANSIGEGRAVVKAAEKYNRIVQIGTQQRCGKHYKEVVDIIRSGLLGDIHAVKVWDHDQRWPGFGSPPDQAPPPKLDWGLYLGPTPKAAYNPNRYFHHYFFFNYGNGWANDWGVHHFDIVHWALGVKYPKSAVATGGKYAFDKDFIEWPDTYSAIAEYGPGPVAKNGFILEYSARVGCRLEKLNHGKVFCGTRGSLRLAREGYEIFSEAHGDKKVLKNASLNYGKESVRLPREMVDEPRQNLRFSRDYVHDFLRNVRARTQPQADVETGHTSSTVGHLMNISWKLGRKVTWNGEQEAFVGDPEANALITKAYRKPWSLEV